MFKVFHSSEETEIPASGSEGLLKEHQAFAHWLESQPEDRKKMYLQLAVSYGFRMHNANEQGEKK